jgi:hypothetical protein
LHLYTFFLPISLLAFDVNGQTKLIFELLRKLLCSYVLLIYLILRLFWFCRYHLFLLYDQRSTATMVARKRHRVILYVHFRTFCS